ncbi:MAG: sugar ABC transporter substrate-binding protein [Spartobacteria bacterium]|nr:sugar ABC transporter substrate-binding protein [Spartobacteria bacterium]
MNKNSLIKLMSATLICGLAFTLGSGFGFGKKKDKDGANLNENGDVIRLTIASHYSNVPAWVPVQNGIEDAAKLLNIDVNVVGPTDFSIAKQVELIEGAIASGIDGLGTTMPDAEAFNDVTKEAMSRGIPVIALNADAPNTGRLCYIGQSNYGAGYEVGKKVVSMVKGGKVLIGIHSLGAANLIERMDGIKAALADAGGYDVKVVATTKDLVQATSLVSSWYQANKDVKAMVGVDEISGIAIMQVVRREEIGDKVVSGGFDLVPELLEGINDGDFTFTIDQQPYMQGFYTVMQLYNNIKYKLVPSSMDTGTAIITKGDVTDVIKLAKDGYR